MAAERDLHFFALLARKGSFTETALELGVSPSAVSRRLARIEDRLGVRLLNRTTRRISLTGEGEAFFSGAVKILGEIEDLEQSISRSRENPRGILRLNTTFQFGREHVAAAISEFVRLYPDLQVQMVLSDAPLNLVEEGFDLGIRFGLPPSSRLIVQLLLRNRRFLCASPDYLERHGEPKRLADLANHNCIILRQEYESYDTWRFEKDGDTQSVKVSGNLSSNEGEIAVNWVLDGHGIMLRSEWDIARHIKAGRLCIVLPRYVHTADIYAVYPEKHNLTAKVGLFVAFLQNRLKRTAESAVLSLDDVNRR
jgi:LysR family transcriptional regulator, transcriptional activator for dmlA